MTTRRFRSSQDTPMVCHGRENDNNAVITRRQNEVGVFTIDGNAIRKDRCVEVGEVSRCQTT